MEAANYTQDNFGFTDTVKLFDAREGKSLETARLHRELLGRGSDLRAWRRGKSKKKTSLLQQVRVKLLPPLFPFLVLW